MLRPRMHGPTINGRLRSDPGLLVLIGLVVALTTALTAAVGPLTERAADRAIAGTVRAAGSRGAVVATAPQGYDDPEGRKRDPLSAKEIRQDTGYAHYLVPRRLAAVLGPGVATLSTPALHLLDNGPGRYLTLAYVDTSDGPPAVRYTAGGPPRASVGAARAGTRLPADAAPWPVQVALSEAAAKALGLRPGDRLPAEDEHHRAVRIRISGVYRATDPHDEGWQTFPDLLDPSQGVSDGLRSTSASALVSPDSLPDLRLALPADDLYHHIVFMPRPAMLRWRSSSQLQQAVVSLQASAGVARHDVSWDSVLDRVLADGRAQVASARGQAQVLLIGLLTCALLLLALAAQLLVRRRAGSLAITRERGASLLAIAAELLIEALLVAAAAAALGLGAVRVLVGPPDWRWSVPILLVAASAVPVLGAVVASRATDVRRVPANRAVRAAGARLRRLRRLALEAAVVAIAVLSFVALRQRGVTGGVPTGIAGAGAGPDGGVGTGGRNGGDLMAAGAVTWWAAAGTLVVLRLLPPMARLSLRTARRATGGVRFLVMARLARTATRALPLLLVAVATAQLTVGVALAATEQSGQSAGALLAVGGDARLTAPAAPDVDGTARAIAGSPGVRAAASGRVADGVQVSSARSADSVRLVVVDAPGYRRLLAASALPDAPQLDRLRAGAGDRVPALLLGGDANLRDGPAVQWGDTTVPLELVGTAPQVEASSDPVIVVDASAFARAGAVAEPNTVWAVGPGAAAAVKAHAAASASVVLYADQLDARRQAPLSSALVRLAAVSSALLLLVALLGLVLAAAADAPDREASLGRLRSLGLPDGSLWRVLAGEVVTPVVAAVLAGLGLGLGCALATFGSLSLERITGQQGQPQLVVPWWTPLAGVVLVAGALSVTVVEWRRLRRRTLAELLRS